MVARVLTLLAALLVAAIGAALVLSYVAQADRRAAQDFDGVVVYMAIDTVPAETTVKDALDHELIAPREITRNAVRLGAVQVADDALFAQPIRQAMVANDQLVEANIGVPEQDNPLALDAESNALFVTFEDPNRLAGVLAPGNLVSVYLTYTPQGKTASCTQLLIDAIEVVSVDGRSVNDAETQAGAASGNIGFKVDEGSEAQLIQAQTMGELYLVLLGPPTATAPESSSPSTPSTASECVNSDDVFKAGP